MQGAGFHFHASPFQVGEVVARADKALLGLEWVEASAVAASSLECRQLVLRLTFEPKLPPKRPLR